MFRRLAEDGLLGPTIALLVIGLCVIYLLFSTVIPNFHFKSVPISWFTSVGALIFLAYAILVEMKEETHISSFPTYCLFDSRGEPLSPWVPPTLDRGEERLGFLRELGSLRITPAGGEDDWSGPAETTELGRELIFLNCLSYMSAGFRDWRRQVVETPSATTYRYRLLGKTGKDTVFDEGDLLKSEWFNWIEFGDLSNPSRDAFSVYPPGTRVTVDERGISVSNKSFKFQLSAQNTGLLYQTQFADKNVYCDEFLVETKFSLLKSRAGSLNRDEIRSFCFDLRERIEDRLAVAETDFPKRAGWGG